MSEKKYTKDHEWVSIENEIATIGISNHAQESLGDIVFIELPSVGNSVKAKDEICVVESVKAASDIYAPIDGEIIEGNETELTWEKLSKEQKKLPIANLNNKENIQSK